MRLTRSTALAAALLAAGCSAHATHPAPSTPPPTGMDADPTGPVATGPAPGAEPAALVAGDAVGIFCDHDPDPVHWWAVLAPHLSGTARVAYAGTDPGNVPGTRVTAPAVTGPAPASTLAAVQVPTDAGTYGVLLSVDDAGAWQVERFELPAGTH